MPERIQLRRTKGWRKPEGAVVVSRRSVWSNPFIIGSPSGHSFRGREEDPPLIEALTREQAVRMYWQLVRGMLTPEMHPHGHNWIRTFRAKMDGGNPAEMAQVHLRGRDLCCWCSLDQPCHADVLLDLANQ